MSGSELLLNVSMIMAAAVLLWKGAQWLVDSSVRIARTLGISELAIGLTIVSLGTSAPEFAVTINAAIRGQPDISIGNVVGSNIFNMGFILGGCAIVRAIRTTPQMVWRDGLLLLLASFLLMMLTRDGTFSRLDGALFIAILVAYVGYLFWSRDDGGEETTEGRASWRDLPIFVAGCVGVVGGGHLLVHGASAIARSMGVTEWVIAVTIVAAGTSLPELATSLTAAIKGKYGLSAGNLIGSDIFNLLGVLGTAGVIRPLPVHPSAHESLVVLVIMVGIVTIFLRTGWRLSRREGVFLVVVNLIRWILDFTAGKGG